MSVAIVLCLHGESLAGSGGKIYFGAVGSGMESARALGDPWRNLGLVDLQAPACWLGAGALRLVMQGRTPERHGVLLWQGTHGSQLQFSWSSCVF